MSGYLQAPAALPPEKKPPVHTKYETECQSRYGRGSEEKK